MDLLFTSILDLLNGLIPSALTAEFQGLNEILTYFITIMLIWAVIFRPLLKLFRVIR